MAVGSFWADATTLAQMLAASTIAAKRAVIDSRLGAGTLTVTVRDGSGTVKATGTMSGADFTVDENAIASITLSAVSGDGGTPGAGWTLRVANAGGNYIEFPKSTWTYLGPDGESGIDTGDGIQIDLTISGTGGAYQPGSPPAAVSTWLVQLGTTVQVPADFLGIHSDYVAGVTYPVAPDFMAKIGCVRSLDFDPDRGWTVRLAWAAMETSAGNYTWTWMDRWVAEHSGKRLIYVIDRCPSFYAKYSSAHNDLYPSFPNSSSPPSDWTKAANLCLAIKARYPNEDWIFELWNEPGFPWAGTTEGNRFTQRMDDAWIQTYGGAPFFTGSAQDLANGAKTLYNAGVRPLMGIAAEGDGEPDNYTWYGNDTRRVFQCPTTGGGVGADWYDIMSYHSYTYSGDGRKILDETVRYQAIQQAIGMGGKPLIASEVGHEIQLANTMSDIEHSTNVIRWAYITAALGVRNMVMYKLDSAAPSGGANEARNLKYYSDPNSPGKLASNAALSAAITEAHKVCGKTIGQAARLSDGSIWIEFTDGTTVRR